MKDNSTTNTDDTEAEKQKAEWRRQHLLRIMAEEVDCPVFDGVGEIEESDSPYVIITTPDGLGAFKVSREFAENCDLSDSDAILEEALIGGLEEE